MASRKSDNRKSSETKPKPEAEWESPQRNGEGGMRLYSNSSLHLEV